MAIKLKKDAYRRARGGWARLLEIFCARCGKMLLQYQKDGPGILKRLYLDRILAPPQWELVQHLPRKRVPPLSCPRCRVRIGTPGVYAKERRAAYMLLPGSFKKQIVKIG